jgi:non-ribosomal peptide synthetase component E (peptide arylation enzyme)
MKLSEFASYHKLAIVSHDSKLSYSDLKHRVILGAQYLIDKGLSSESIVGVEIKDELEHFIATLSLLLLGAKKITFASYDSSQFKSDLILKVSIKNYKLILKQALA